MLMVAIDLSLSKLHLINKALEDKDTAINFTKALKLLRVAQNAKAFSFCPT